MVFCDQENPPQYGYFPSFAAPENKNTSPKQKNDPHKKGKNVSVASCSVWDSLLIQLMSQWEKERIIRFTEKGTQSGYN